MFKNPAKIEKIRQKLKKSVKSAKSPPKMKKICKN